MNINLSKFIHNGTIQIRVTPHSSRTELVEEEGKLKLYLQALPEKDKANRELVKFFKKRLNLRVEIVTGLRNRNKNIRLL